MVVLSTSQALELETMLKNMNHAQGIGFSVNLLLDEYVINVQFMTKTANVLFGICLATFAYVSKFGHPECAFDHEQTADFFGQIFRINRASCNGSSSCHVCDHLNTSQFDTVFAAACNSV